MCANTRRVRGARGREGPGRRCRRTRATADRVGAPPRPGRVPPARARRGSRDPAEPARLQPLERAAVAEIEVALPQRVRQGNRRSGRGTPRRASATTGCVCASGNTERRHDLERDSLLARDTGDLGDDVAQQLRGRLVRDGLWRGCGRVLLVGTEGASLPLDDSGRADERVAQPIGGVPVEVVEDGRDLVEQPTRPIEPGVDLLEVEEVVVDRLGALEVARSQQRGQPRGRVLLVGPRRPGRSAGGVAGGRGAGSAACRRPSPDPLRARGRASG